LVGKLGPEYSKMMDGLEQVDPNSSEGKEFMSVLSRLDNLCTGPALAQPVQQPAPVGPALPNLPLPNLPLPNLPLPNLRPPNPRPFNLRPFNLRPFNLRRREPAHKSERHAHRLVLFPTGSIWALG